MRIHRLEASAGRITPVLVLAICLPILGCGDDSSSSPCDSPIGQYDECAGPDCTCAPKTGARPVITDDTITNECSQSYPVTIDGTSISISANNLTATLSADGAELTFSNGAVWVRTCP